MRSFNNTPGTTSFMNVHFNFVNDQTENEKLNSKINRRWEQKYFSDYVNP